MPVSGNEKYLVCLHRQQLSNARRAMFEAKPGSTEHHLAVIKYDRLRVDLKYIEKMLSCGTVPFLWS
jgi:hypothetical protein